MNNEQCQVQGCLVLTRVQLERLYQATGNPKPPKDLSIQVLWDKLITDEGYAKVGYFLDLIM